MNAGVKVSPMLNLALIIHGDSAGPSGCCRQLESASPGAGTCKESFEVLDDSEGEGDSYGGIDLSLDEEPMSCSTNFLGQARKCDGGRSLIIVGASSRC